MQPNQSESSGFTVVCVAKVPSCPAGDEECELLQETKATLGDLAGTPSLQAQTQPMINPMASPKGGGFGAQADRAVSSCHARAVFRFWTATGKADLPSEASRRD